MLGTGKGYTNLNSAICNLTSLKQSEIGGRNKRSDVQIMSACIVLVRGYRRRNVVISNTGQTVWLSIGDRM